MSCATKFAQPQNEYLDIDRTGQVYESETAENINGLFPDKVYIKSKTQSFNSLYEFQIYYGKIYYKDIHGKEPELWKKLKNNGLPSNFFERGFRNPDRIIEINADSNELYALSDEGIFYHIRFTKDFLKSGWKWEQRMGWPDKASLIMDRGFENKRSWALSRRGEEVLWYEDINGNQHHYGTIGIVTNYLLMEDGQEIKFADPGLPSDFSHNILGPERGTFIARSLSASASTLFVINSSGEMYTRLVDFDTIGSDPMFFKYTYDRYYSDSRPGSDYDTNFNQWALPAEEWKKQPAIELSGKASLTDRITIVQNGYGNTSRELRVAGINHSGSTGFFFKQIDDSDWQFKQASLEFTESLTVSAGESSVGPRGASPDRNYTGRLWSGPNEFKNISLRLEGFNLLEGSAELKIIYGKESFFIDFYPVEMWYYLKRREPGRDGTPKLFMVTIDIPEDGIEKLSKPFQFIMNKYFMPWDIKTFAFTAEAAGGYLFVESVDSNIPVLSMFFTVNEQDLNINIEILRKYYLLQNDNTAVSYFTDDLSVDENEIGKQSKGRIMELLHKNQIYLENLENKIIELEGYNFSSRVSNYTYTGVEGFLNLTGLYKIDYPKIYTMTRHSGTIFEKIMNSAEATIHSKLWLYNYIREHITRRIENYEHHLRENESHQPFFESPLDYFEIAGVDFKFIRTELKLNNSSIDIDTSLTEELPLIIIIDRNTNESHLLEFINFEKTIIEYIENDGILNKDLCLRAKLTDVKFNSRKKKYDVTFFYDSESIRLEGADGKFFYNLEFATPDLNELIP